MSKVTLSLEIDTNNVGLLLALFDVIEKTEVEDSLPVYGYFCHLLDLLTDYARDYVMYYDIEYPEKVSTIARLLAQVADRRVELRDVMDKFTP